MYLGVFEWVVPVEQQQVCQPQLQHWSPLQCCAHDLIFTTSCLLLLCAVGMAFQSQQPEVVVTVASQVRLAVAQQVLSWVCLAGLVVV